MADPFANIRRRPAAAATYGRKALAARRAAVAVSALSAGSGKSPVLFTAAHTKEKSSDDSDSNSNSSESDGETGDTADRPWVRRTAHLAISKLDSLYENTKSEPFHSLGSSDNSTSGISGSTAIPSSSREVLEATKDKWDLDEIPSNPFMAAATVSKKTSNAGGISKPPAKPPPKRALVGGSKAIKKVKSAQPASRMNGSKADSISKPVIAKAGRGGKRTAVTTKASVSRARLKNARTSPANSQPASSDHEAATSVFEMSDLLSSSPIFARTKGPRRPVKSKRSRGSIREGNDSLLSSSPPSTPGRLLDSGKCSQLLSGHAGSEYSDSDSIREHAAHLTEATVADVSATPIAQIGNRQVLNSIQGPSTATSKRLQMRAYTHNVVYTYGRSRDDEDYDLVGDGGGALGIEISPTLRVQAVFETTGRPALENFPYDSNMRAPGRLLDLIDPVDPKLSSGNASHNESEREVSVGPFKQQLGDIIHGLSTANRTEDSTSLACEKLLSRLEDQDFCDDLLASKSKLSALVQTLGRIRDDPVILSATTALIAIAFLTPTAMQMLVFEKQILETVAGILKTVSTNTAADILALRRKHDFDSPAQFGCAEQICRLAHGHNLLNDGKMPLSMYSLALCALFGFSRNNDVALVAIAPLLRNEMHESGCLGLVAERVLAMDLPAFVEQQRKSLFTVPNSKAQGLFPKKSGFCSQPLTPNDNNEGDDVWMDFDLPEETKKAPVFYAGKKSKPSVAKEKLAATSYPTRHNKRNAKAFDRLLSQEPSAITPSFAFIGVELEILRFCIAANIENQEELLSIESCVPTLLHLLTVCQQTCARTTNLSLNQVLETLALDLQLLVNLSYGSTAFCSRFFASEGLAIVAKSIALMSRGLDSIPDKHSLAEHNSKVFAPRRKAQLAEDENSLKYDVLLISCALLINVVESDPSSTVYFGHVLQSPRCQLEGKCFPVCACTDKMPLVALITGAFLGRCLEEESNMDASVTAGYLAVLLGFLMRDSGPIRQAILNQLPGKSTSTLLEHIRKFVQISSTVNQNVASGLLNTLGVASVDTLPNCHLQQQNSGHHQCLPSPLGQHQPLCENSTDVKFGSRLDVYGKKLLPASLQSVIDLLGKM
ncbi:hypothetical protein IW140_001903 [Coemansia sp. RSA 1813]|nr:hypothetical protein LPJ74_003635 [Coemansia sp. RSA 1843]KAJ2087252.1 hypothetical protein IW138_005098 [Coemansia sp. RSA 986]KAJ2570949.1 hypothetical protein IW140_001903 [Coemansia sp. RSA 1813]